jgi:hypothetical protein
MATILALPVVLAAEPVDDELGPSSARWNPTVGNITETGTDSYRLAQTRAKAGG